MHKDDELWLAAFTNEISKPLKPTSLTLHDTVEDIKDAIRNLQDITIKYNIKKKISDILLTKAVKKRLTAKHLTAWFIQSMTHPTYWKLHVYL